MHSSSDRAPGREGKKGRKKGKKKGKKKGAAKAVNATSRIQQAMTDGAGGY